jgi:beta-RFAP synthase
MASLASSPAAVEIRSPARLHLGMLSFGVPGARSHGGLGVMIERPGVHVRMAKADRFTATGPLADRADTFARACHLTWGLAPQDACAIEVLEVPASHAGFGSGTQLGLAVAAGMRQLYPSSDAAARGAIDATSGETTFDAAAAVALARGVGRGRRSCVGIYGFGGGGLILEGGRLPAQSPVEAGFSPLVARVRLPEAWRCVVFTLRDVSGLHGDAERQAFATLPPVARETSAELARIALLELVPAAVEGRFAEFAGAVTRYGRLAGEPFAPVSAELPYADITEQLFASIASCGAKGAAQSSWGPTVMACAESQAEAEAIVTRFHRSDLGCSYDATIARFDRRGAVLRDIDERASAHAFATGKP